MLLSMVGNELSPAALAPEEDADSASADLWHRAKAGRCHPCFAVPCDGACLPWALGVGRSAFGVLAYHVADHGLFFATCFPRLCNPHSFSALQVLSPMQAAASDREDRQSQQ